MNAKSMYCLQWLSACLLSIHGLAFPGVAESRRLIFEEQFQTLQQWEAIAFKDIPEKSMYTLRGEDDEARYLEMSSNAAASALYTKEVFTLRPGDVLRWEWRVDKHVENADPYEKEGDDFPIRVYLVFLYDSGEASFLEELRYESLKAIYGEYPPYASLMYVWSSTSIEKTRFESPYTSRAQTIALRMGREKQGVWVSEKTLPFDDYQQLFHDRPPKHFRLALMTDSDNTGSSTKAFIKSIRLERRVWNGENKNY